MTHLNAYLVSVFSVAIALGSLNTHANHLPAVLGGAAKDCASDSELRCVQAGRYIWNWGKIGDSECLRNTYPIREIVDPKLWDTHGLVSVIDPESANPRPSSVCPSPQVPNIPKFLFVQSTKGAAVLHVDLEDASGKAMTTVEVPMSKIRSIDNKKVFWLYGSDKNFDYYLYILDNNPNDKPIDKVYWLELFPSGGIHLGAITPCDKERPDYAPPGTTDFVNLSPDTNNGCHEAVDPEHSGKQQINSGGGGEPDHP